LTNEELLLRAGIGDLQDIVATTRRRFIGHVLRPDVKTSQANNRLDSRGRMQKMGQAKADVAGHVHGRHESNG